MFLLKCSYLFKDKKRLKTYQNFAKFLQECSFQLEMKEPETCAGRINELRRKKMEKESVWTI